jgi:hypothetical protein
VLGQSLYIFDVREASACPPIATVREIAKGQLLREARLTDRSAAKIIKSHGARVGLDPGELFIAANAITIGAAAQVFVSGRRALRCLVCCLDQLSCRWSLETLLAGAAASYLVRRKK